MKTFLRIFLCLFCCFRSQVSSYGHGQTVSSPNHTSLNKQLTSTSCTYFRLELTNNPSWMIQGKGGEWLYKLFHDQSPRSMGPGLDRTRDPWICSRARICCHTRYWLRYVRSRIFSWDNAVYKKLINHKWLRYFEIWAATQETPSSGFSNNTGADQPDQRLFYSLFGK